MSLFYPDFDFKRIYEIPASFFTERGITALLLDVDNTLTTDNNPIPHHRVLEWLDGQREAGLRLMVLSNNSEERVAPFAKSLGLEYIARAHKPLSGTLRHALLRMGVELHETALIGDQLFTDVLCGRLAGCLTILVEPMAMEGYGFYRVKRFFEKGILRRYRSKRKEST